ncbi:unnamed protein product [Chrysoparadoxa australica]
MALVLTPSEGWMVQAGALRCHGQGSGSSRCRLGLCQPQRSRPRSLSMISRRLDLSIEMGDVDPELEAAIEPALKVISPICDLIDTTDDVFTFKYHGQIKNLIGFEAYAKVLIDECYPKSKGVVMKTNRSRDERDK